MSQPAVDVAIAALPLPTEPLVLDTGCGGGEILLRTLQLHPGARGLGIDLDADAIAEARQRTEGLPARFEVRDAATVESTRDFEEIAREILAEAKATDEAEDELYGDERGDRVRH